MIIKQTGGVRLTDSEFRKLNRAELLEMLIEVVKENDELKRNIQDLTDRLESKELMISESGSLSDAVLKLNGVFEAAENAVAQYMYNIEGRKGAAGVPYMSAGADADSVVRDAYDRADQIILEAETKAAMIVGNARRKADLLWKQAYDRFGNKEEDTE